MKQVIKVKDTYHLVTRTRRLGGCDYYTNCECGYNHTSTKEPYLFDATNRVPTCEHCLQKFFNKYKTNYALKKQVDFYRGHTNMLLDGLGNLINAQRYSIDQCDSKVQEYKEGSYPFIPNSTGRIFHEFNLVKGWLKEEKRWSGHSMSRTQFLDAGCGIGNIMLLARTVGMCNNIHGIEYFKETAEKARNWLGAKTRYDSLKIFESDIMKFRNYKDYDIIYFYCPFSDERLQVLFEERLENHMKVGAILIPHLKKGNAIRKDDRFERIKVTKNAINDGYGYGPLVFIKVKDGRRKVSEAKRVRCERRISDGKDIAAEKYNLLKKK